MEKTAELLDIHADGREALVLSLPEVAEMIQSDALDQARERTVRPGQDPAWAVLLQRHDFFEHYKYGLAHRLGSTLAAQDDGVQAVYYFDPALNADAETEEYGRLDPTVNLLVLVESKSAALDAFIAALDRALTAEANALPSPALASVRSILNAIVITEGDVMQGRGYAALLSSMFTRPLQVW